MNFDEENFVFLIKNDLKYKKFRAWIYDDIKKQSGVKQLIVLVVYKLQYLVFLFAEELCEFLEYIVKKKTYNSGLSSLGCSASILI